MAENGKVPLELLRVAVEQIEAVRRGMKPKNLYRLGGGGYWMRLVLSDMEWLQITIYHESAEMILSPEKDEVPNIGDLVFKSQWSGSKHKFNAEDFVDFLRAALYPYHKAEPKEAFVFDQ